MTAHLVVTATESLIHRDISSQHADPDLDSFRASS